MKDGDTFTPINVPGATQTEALGINAAGEIVGWFSPATGPGRGFLKDGDTFTPINVPGATQTFARGINEVGEIVGTFRDATGNHGFLAIPVSVPVIVEIDIKPGGDPNSINCNNDNGVIPVAILTTDDFDAAAVDHTTVAFEGATEIHTDPRSGEPRRHEEDVDGDGDIDLVFHFRLGDTDRTCGSTEGTLTGETFDGAVIEGTDSVNMIGS